MFIFKISDGLASMKLGDVTYLTPQEAAASARTNAALVARPWELWTRKAMKTEKELI